MRDVERDDTGQVAAAIASCSWPRAAARWACSPPSAGCAPCTSGSPPRSRTRACRSTPSTSTAGVGALVDIFRAEEDACLLGTDAVRDGVDVPGRSLRLLVFDRVPWPRPDILHGPARPRKAAGAGGKAYDDSWRGCGSSRPSAA